jgi:hypothetical protein
MEPTGPFAKSVDAGNGRYGPSRAHPFSGLNGGRRPGSRKPLSVMGERGKRARPSRKKGPRAWVPGKATGRQRFGRTAGIVGRKRPDENPEAGSPKRVVPHERNGPSVTLSGAIDSDTRRDCSSLKTEECGLHVSTRRACSVAPPGLLRETRDEGGLAGEKANDLVGANVRGALWRSGCGSFE